MDELAEGYDYSIGVITIYFTDKDYHKPGNRPDNRALSNRIQGSYSPFDSKQCRLADTIVLFGA